MVFSNFFGIHFNNDLTETLQAAKTNKKRKK